MQTHRSTKIQKLREVTESWSKILTGPYLLRIYPGPADLMNSLFHPALDGLPRDDAAGKDILTLFLHLGVHRIFQVSRQRSPFYLGVAPLLVFLT